jgi:hypothetical protein
MVVADFDCLAIGPQPEIALEWSMAGAKRAGLPLAALPLGAIILEFGWGPIALCPSCPFGNG